MVLDVASLLLMALPMIGASARSKEATKRGFRALFGMSITACLELYRRCDYQSYDKKIKPKHHLWGLMFMRTHAAETVHAAIAGFDKKTFRKWSWLFVKGISKFESSIVSINVIS